MKLIKLTICLIFLAVVLSGCIAVNNTSPYNTAPHAYEIYTLEGEYITECESAQCPNGNCNFFDCDNSLEYFSNSGISIKELNK